MSVSGAIARQVTSPVARSVAGESDGGSTFSAGDALVLIGVGQSLTARRGDVSITELGPANVLMPVGGVGVQDMAFFTVNAEHTSHKDEWASAVQIDETPNADQSPCGGAALQLANSSAFAKCYIVTVGVGARDLHTLGAGGPRCNLHAAIRRLCALARADGYSSPKIAFFTAHGESSMANGRSEADYYEAGMRFYGMCQIMAAQELGDPTYYAPIVFSHPQSNQYGAATEAVHAAMKRLIDDIPNAISIGSASVFASHADRIHNTDAGQANRGEVYGYAVRQFFEASTTLPHVYITNVSLAGAVATVTMSESVIDDSANFDFGENLNAANAWLGFEWFDNGSGIAINSGAVSGTTITLNLASTPVGTLAQQKLRLAMQATTAPLVSGSSNRSGTPIRAAGSGVDSLSPVDEPTWYRFPIPQTFILG